jgi:WD40 repeat protein
MSYCLNPSCQKPDNPSKARFCSSCGSKLLLGDRYRILKKISPGGMGRTFLAVDDHQVSQPPCVIKQFLLKNQGTSNTQKAVELFRQEVSRLQVLSQHEQIPKVLAHFEIQERQYLVQTFIQGQTLAEQMTTEGAFSETQIRQLLKELLPVLQFVHNQGVIHRDINPENLIRRLDQQLILVDFGAAKITTKTALAKTGTLIGSAAYTAPEQLIGKALFASDLYSLGVTCIHLLTGIHPFDLFNSWEGTWVWRDYLSHPIDPDLCQILDKMVASSVNQRYQSAEEILQHLQPQQKIALPAVAEAMKSLTPTWTCVSTLFGHGSSVYAIAFSPNGEILASASADNTIKLWHLETSVCFCTLSGHSSLVNAVAFLPKGMLASGSWDHTIKLWDWETGDLLHTLKGHSGWIQCIAISPDGQLLASGSADRTIKLWNLGLGMSPTLLCTLSGHQSAVQAIAFNNTGKILASGSADQTIKIWDLSKGDSHNLLGHSQSVKAITISPGGQILVSGSEDQTLKVWHLGTRELLQTLTGHTGSVNSVTISANGRLFLSGSADQTLKIWHPGTSELLYTLNGHTDAVTSIAISSDSSAIASGSQDKTIKIWRYE